MRVVCAFVRLIFKSFSFDMYIFVQKNKTDEMRQS